MILLAIDPGACAGLATFHDGTLANVALLDASQVPFRWIPWLTPDVCVVERAHQGQGAATKKDIVTLSIRAGALAQAAGGRQTIFLEPGAWKGSTPKRITEQRVAEALTPPERSLALACLEPYLPSVRHNAIDAIGIGLRYLKRTRV